MNSTRRWTRIPKFDLEPAEAGHPIWGPVWRSVKTARAAKPKPK